MRLAVGILVCGTACGPSREQVPRQTCGGDEPVQLMAMPELGVAADVALYGPTFIGERVVVHRLEGEGQHIETVAFAADACGERFTPLESMGGLVGGADEWAFARLEDGDGLRRVALDGSGPSELVFDTAIVCVIVMDDALVAADADGTLWVLEDPGDPASEPAQVASGAIVPRFDRGGADLTECWAPGGELPVRDGDGLLVAFRDGPLARVAVPSGEREVLVEGPVGEFVVLEDPRYILWRGGRDFDPASDCCSLHVLDRSTGRNLDVAGSTLPETVQWRGEWLSSFGFATNELTRPTETFTNVATGESFWIDDWWTLHGILDEARLLLSRVGDEERSTWVLDTRTRQLQPLDFPEPPFDAPTYPDGVVALVRPEGEHAGTLMLLPSAGGPIEVLADGVDEDFARTQSGGVVFVHRDREDAPTGTLVHVTRAGTRHDLATDVAWFQIPFHGSVREREEILFVVHGAERGGLWRYVLP